MAKQKLWQTDDEFEMLLQQSLSAIQPPADFSNRVMAAVRAEKQQEKQYANIIPFAEVQKTAEKAKAKERRFGPGFWPGLGTIAASLVLFLWAGIALPGGSEAPMLQNSIEDGRMAEYETLAKVVRMAEANPAANEPVAPAVAAEPNANAAAQNQPSANANEPTEMRNAAEQPTEPSAPTEAQPQGTITPADIEPPLDESGAGELILPRAAFGKEAQGTLSVRLLAEVENNQIYTPNINKRGSAATFYTADEENVYSWRVNLSTADSPEVSIITSRSAIDDIGSLLSKTCAPCDATTLVSSPDNTIIAQNSPNGIWISLAEGEVYSLSDEAGGSLLAWSPDSSKLLFTNSQGQLFMGYPLEKRIYQITDMSVEDVCWSTDNQTIIFLANVDGQSALYIAELI